MRKLSTIKNNIFTVKLLDIFLPTDLEKSLEAPNCVVDDSFLKNLTHIFIVMDRVQSDMK